MTSSSLVTSIYKDRKEKKHRVRLQFIIISSGFDDNSRKYDQVSETDLRIYLGRAVGCYNSTVKKIIQRETKSSTTRPDKKQRTDRPKPQQPASSAEVAWDDFLG